MSTIFRAMCRLIIFITSIFLYADLASQDVSDTAIVTADSALVHDDCDSIEEVLVPTVQEAIDPSLIHPRSSVGNPSWLFAIFLVQFVIIASARVFYAKDLEEMLRAVMNLNIAQQLHREEGKTMPVSSILYNVNFVISGAIFLFLVGGDKEWFIQESSFVNMLFSLWLVMLLFSARYGFLKLISWIFPFGKVLDHYNFNFFLHQKMLGVLLVPFNLLIAYFPYGANAVVGVTLLLMSLVMLIILVKGWRISYDLIREHKFHFIIYLCTLEIAPVSILVKVVVEWVIRS